MLTFWVSREGREGLWCGVVDRLLVDLDVGGRVSVSTWWEGELPGGVGEPVELAWPLGADELEDLRWYLEDYLRAPFGVYEGRGSQIADRLPVWGRALFTALFGSGPARDAYIRVRTRATAPGRAEIVLRSAASAWLGLPWELLHDPHLPAPLALDGIGLSRGLPVAHVGEAFDVGGQRLRVLMVISRPAGSQDVGYRMIARPLLRRLAAVRGEVEVEVLRPPTLAALAERLQVAREAGIPFQIVHFDGHGVLLGDRAGQPSDAGGRGGEGMLVFEHPGGGADYVGADRVARVLAEARVPVVVLNACQSGAVGKQLEATVATRLLAGGASAVVAMAYSVYAVAAAEFMTAFYERLFAGDTVGDAVSAGRTRMAQRPGRPSPKGELPLADWAVPVYYWRREVRFPHLHAEPGVRADSSLEERLDRLREPSAGVRDDPLDSAEEFVGRDGLFHSMEVAARTDRVLVLHGPGGAGKTELAKAFARWWRDTGGVARPDLVVWHSFEPGVASFGLDGVISTIGLRVFGADFGLKSPDMRRDLVHDLLREQRLLLIWDNFESVASMPDPTSATPPLDDAGRCELRDFLHRVAADGRSAILVTSRTPEDWLGDLRRIAVGGLTSDEAIEYADQILKHVPSAGPRRAERAFAELLEWLNGHPLSMRLILPHLETTDPGVLLAGLCGTGPAPEGSGAGRTGSLSASIAYSITQLDPTDRRLLAAVGLFHGIVADGMLSAFSRLEQTPQRFTGITSERWNAVLGRAAHVGLLTKLTEGLYGIHPALPAYLAAQWRAESPDAYEQQRASAERALLDAYAGLGAMLESNIQSGDAARAYRVIDLHRRTMGQLLGYALDNGLWPQAGALMSPLNSFWERRGLTEEANGWGDRARTALVAPDGAPPPLDQPGGQLWLFLIDTRVGRLLRAGDLDTSEAACAEALDVLEAQSESAQQRQAQGAFYHRLGGVAKERGRWDDAERWYRKALAIAEELGDQKDMARSFRQLGDVARHRGRWDDAERWYHKSLALEKQLRDQRGMALVFDKLGNLAQMRGEWDDAEDWYRESLAVSEELGDQDGMARSCHQLGMLAQRRGRLDDAEQWYHRSLPVAEKSHDRAAKVASYHQLGLLAQRRGRPDEAEQWYRESLAIAEELGSKDRMAESYQLLGVAAHLRKRLDEAEQWYRKALAIAEELGDQDRISRSFLLLGGMAHHRGQWDDAEQWYHRAIAIEKEMGRRFGMVAAYIALGELAEVRGRTDDALEWTVRSMVLFNQGPHPDDGGPHSQLAKLADRLGWHAVERCWKRVTGVSPPADIRELIETQQEANKSMEGG